MCHSLDDPENSKAHAPSTRVHTAVVLPDIEVRSRQDMGTYLETESSDYCCRIQVDQGEATARV